MSATSGLGRTSRSSSLVKCENTTSPAACFQPSVMRRSSASEFSALASGDAAFLCCASGRNGLGELFSGQASSVRPVTQRWSNSTPADSQQAEHLDRRIRRFRLERRIGADLSQRLKRLGEGHLLRDSIEARQLAERFVPLGLRLELVRVERALARKAGGLEPPEKCRAHSAGVFCENSPVSRIPNTRSSLSRSTVFFSRKAISFGSATVAPKLVAQPRLEFHACAELALGAADERRADDPTRLFE